MDNNFKSGFVTILGEANVGKSTLLNAIIGEKIAITSKKPQTTRKNMKGIYTDEDAQIVFVDTPGIHKSKNKLDDYMDLSIKKSLEDVDLILYIIDIKNLDRDVLLEDFKTVKRAKQYKILVVNKIDLYDDIEDAKKYLYENIDEEMLKGIFNDIIYISSLKNKNIDYLVKQIKSYLPYGPIYYDTEQLTDEPIKNIIAELIRQQCLYKLNKEIPHGIAVVVDKMKETKTVTTIYATIVCEKMSHKGIVIGKNGAMLKNIGTASRIAIEKLIDNKVNLQLFVTVKENWRDDNTRLINFGFNKKVL